MKYYYQAEKFSTARRLLMLPHPHGEAESISDAFHECSLGLDDLDVDSLPDDVQYNIRELEQLMDVEGIEDPAHRGLQIIKAEQLSVDERFTVSRTIDSLTDWFARADEG